MIYISFIGNHDKFNPTTNSFGPLINIYNDFKDEIKYLFLLVTPNTKWNDYKEFAKANIEHISSINPKTIVEIIDVKIENPIDYHLIYPIMLDASIKAIKKYNIADSKKIINISSGTPTMTSCWVLLSQSGVINNSKLIQSVEEKHARNGKTTIEVNLTIDDFPNITAPNSLKRKITILERRNKELENRAYIELMNREFPLLIGDSKLMTDIKDQIFNDINKNTSVLIIGERGTGKEVVAKSIWAKYRSDSSKLIPFDCGGFSPNLIESELFGHVKGAFTGADNDKKGIFEEYSEDMILLDEIGNLSIGSQSKLLRLLAEGEYRRTGESIIRNTSAQIIAATNKDINDDNLFAQDIKDRFDEIISLPPLRERREDIPLLIQHFLLMYSESEKLSAPLRFDNNLIDELCNNNWDSNVRGLVKFISRISRRFNKGGLIKLGDIPERFIFEIMNDDSLDVITPALPLPISLDEYRDLIIDNARKQAASHADVDRLLKQKNGTERQRVHRKK